MDVHSPDERSRNMAAIRGKNTQPELIVRRLLHSMGYRFRLHVKTLIGQPDIVLPRHRAIVDVRGCFWHRHRKCRHASTPATRTEFWNAKFAENVARDKRVDRLLKAQGWRVLVVWGCETRDAQELENKLRAFLSPQ